MVTKLTFNECLLPCAFALLAPLATGCLASTVVGGDNPGGSGSVAVTATSTTGSSQGGSGGGTPASNALALHANEFPNPPGTSSSVGAGGSGPDPNMLFVEVDSAPIVCGDPFGDNQCHDHWHVSVGLPSAMQAVGTYSLSDPSIISMFSEAALDQNNVCSGGGGSFFDGTIQVESIDSQGLKVRLAGTSGIGIPAASADGEYVVPRCSVQQTDGIAIRADQFPPLGPSGSSSASGGGGVDPATLYVMVGNHAIACNDPFAVSCASPQWDVSVGLPVADQVPGVYSLSDPAIISTFSESFPSGTDCGGGGGSFLQGTIEVLSVSATQVTVKFAGVSDHTAELEKTLTVSRCQ